MKHNDDKLSTDHLSKDLARRAAQGSALVIAVRSISYAITIGSTAVLARVLTPGDFGLIAMAAVMVTLANRMRSFGLNTATVQSETVSHRQISAIFWVNLGVAAGMAVFLTAVSPLIAWFYGDSRLVGITIWLAVGIVITGLGVQHAAILHRQMRFRMMAGIQIAEAVAGPVAAIVAAVLGAGYWSLVIMVLTQAIVSTTANIVFSGWRPGFIIRNSEIGALIRFGTNVSLTNIAVLITTRIDNILIGRIMGATSLGLYSKAYGLLLLPVMNFNKPMTRTVIPTLSRLQSDPVRYRRYYYRAMTLVASFSLPVVGLMFVSADEMVLTILGDNWIEVASLFRILAPAALIGTLMFTFDWAYVSLGNVGRQARFAWFSTAVTVTAISIGTFWDLNGVAVAVSISRVALFYPALFNCYRGTELGFWDYHRALLRPTVATAVAMGMAYGVGLLAGADASYLLLLIRMTVFGAVYVAIWLGLPGGMSIALDMKSMLLRRDPASQQATA